MAKITACRGFMASGKSTFAGLWVLEAPNRMRSNRDDLRKSLFNSSGVLSYAEEEMISKVQLEAVTAALKAGMDVIIDDTNLRLKYLKGWAKLARKLGAEFEVIDFEVPLSELIRRDNERGRLGHRAVGEDVIRQAWSRFSNPFVPVVLEDEPTASGLYVPDDVLDEAWLFDVDGTTMNMVPGPDGTVRGPFDWHRVSEDEPNMPVIRLVKALASTASIVAVSGRSRVCYDDTLESLHVAGIRPASLHMRPAGDMRPDNLIKEELFWNEIAPRWNVLGVVDDRDQVVKMWRELGIMCAQVAYGDF
jgi:predicted kinase